MASACRWVRIGIGPLSAVILVIGVVIVVATMVSAESLAECQTMREDQRRAARAESDHVAASCQGDRQCIREARAKWDLAQNEIDSAVSACRTRARSQMKVEPPPYLNWKPGDPSPQAKDGRRYLMSCSGKVLGLYKAGGALELELKTHPNNCIPVDTWGEPGPATGTSKDNTCYDPDSWLANGQIGPGKRCLPN
jgi:hypothetical protein